MQKAMSGIGTAAVWPSIHKCSLKLILNMFSKRMMSVCK